MRTRLSARCRRRRQNGRWKRCARFLRRTPMCCGTAKPRGHSAEALVPGDVVYIRAGDVVPADLRLLESMHLQAEESALTGESVPSGKGANAVCDETCGAAERKNMLFSGTGISAGQGVGIVTATGMQTEMGRIAAMLGDEETPDTPLKLRLRRTGKLIGLLVLGICGGDFFDRAYPKGRTA